MNCSIQPSEFHVNSKTHQHPRLISFEGIDGAGKSTQIRLLQEKLIELGHETRVLREPGGTVLGERIRTLLLESKADTSIAPESELLLFAASRAQLMYEQVLPLLRAGVFVILDRFIDSTTAYQGFGRGLDVEFINRLNYFATAGLLPARTFLLDLPVDEAHTRLKGNSEGPDRMEAAGVHFFERVRKGFLTIAQSTSRVHVLDATKPAEALHESVMLVMSFTSKAIATV